MKKGDKFQVLRRNEQTVEDEFIVATIDTQLNQITTTGLSFAPNPNEDYDIRRVMEKATSSGVNIKEGNEQLFTDVLNVYTDNSIDGYVASNSLPSYDITGHLTQESAVGIANTTINFGLDTQNPLNNLYYFIDFNTNTDMDNFYICYATTHTIRNGAFQTQAKFNLQRASYEIPVESDRLARMIGAVDQSSGT